MSETIEKRCLDKGVKLTEQRKIIARVISESKDTYGESDHPDVDELYNRVSKIDPKRMQNKINRKANNGKLNVFDNSFIWVCGMLKDEIIDIRIIWLIRWL